jgi:hypothetical protein
MPPAVKQPFNPDQVSILQMNFVRIVAKYFLLPVAQVAQKIV